MARLGPGSPSGQSPRREVIARRVPPVESGPDGGFSWTLRGKSGGKPPLGWGTDARPDERRAGRAGCRSPGLASRANPGGGEATRPPERFSSFAPLYSDERRGAERRYAGSYVPTLINSNSGRIHGRRKASTEVAAAGLSSSSRFVPWSWASSPSACVRDGPAASSRPPCPGLMNAAREPSGERAGQPTCRSFRRGSQPVEPSPGLVAKDKDPGCVQTRLEERRQALETALLRSGQCEEVERIGTGSATAIDSL